MKTFIKKYNLEILSVFLLFILITILMQWQTESFTHKALCGYIILFTLHEWEETRFPGGFYSIMAKKFKLDLNRFDLQISHMLVALLLIVYILLPFIFPTAPSLLFISVCLGFFEGFVHVMGIFLHKTKKPYTPGMFTAVLEFVYSVYIVKIAFASGYASGKHVAVGFLFMLLTFILMQRTMIGLAGLTYKDMLHNMKTK